MIELLQQKLILSLFEVNRYKDKRAHKDYTGFYMKAKAGNELHNNIMVEATGQKT